MLRFNLKDIALGTLKTSILLIFLEIFASAFFPAIGLNNFRPPFSVLLVLYIAFKINTPLLPFIILIIQNIHSVFSIEGWAISTLIGVIIALSVKYFKDVLDFSTAISTIVVVQISQILWFLMLALFLCIKLSNFANFFTIFWQFVPESIALSLASPLFFILLDKLWISKSVAARA
jgi:hypothetical protein